MASPVELEIVIVNALCAPHSVSVSIDDQPVGEASLGCGPGIRVPPPTIRLPKVDVRAGQHWIRVWNHAAAQHEERLVGLPAIEVAADGAGIFAGAHVRIWIDDDGVVIDEPTAIAQKGL